MSARSQVGLGSDAVPPEEQWAIDHPGSGDPSWHPEFRGWSDGILPFYRAFVENHAFGPKPKNGELIVSEESGFRAVEIGCYYGRSLTFLAEMCFRFNLDEAHVIGIDPGHYRGSHEGLMANIAATVRTWEASYPRGGLGRPPQITMHRAIGREVAPTIADRSLDLVFVDGSHAEKDVLEDCDVWLPKIRPGGTIAGHDYGHGQIPGVKLAVDWRFPKEDANHGPVVLHEHTVWSVLVK